MKIKRRPISKSARRTILFSRGNKCHKDKCIKEGINHSDKEVYLSVCRYCNFNIQSWTQKQSDYLLWIHKCSKHRNKLIIQEIE